MDAVGCQVAFFTFSSRLQTIAPTLPGSPDTLSVHCSHRCLELPPDLARPLHSIFYSAVVLYHIIGIFKLFFNRELAGEPLQGLLPRKSVPFKHPFYLPLLNGRHDDDLVDLVYKARLYQEGDVDHDNFVLPRLRYLLPYPLAYPRVRYPVEFPERLPVAKDDIPKGLSVE